MQVYMNTASKYQAIEKRIFFIDHISVFQYILKYFNQYDRHIKIVQHP